MSIFDKYWFNTCILQIETKEIQYYTMNSISCWRWFGKLVWWWSERIKKRVKRVGMAGQWARERLRKAAKTKKWQRTGYWLLCCSFTTLTDYTLLYILVTFLHHTNNWKFQISTALPSLLYNTHRFTDFCTRCFSFNQLQFHWRSNSNSTIIF